MDYDYLRSIPGFWYVASPYSKHPKGMDVAEAEVCAAMSHLLKEKVPVYSPIVHSHSIALLGHLDPLDHDIWLPANLPLMEASYGLITVMLDSWNTSVGVRHERDWFHAQKKPSQYMEWPL